mgnify:CR=1 FL=1
MKIEKRSFKVFAAVMTIMLIAGALAGCGDKKADKKDATGKTKVVKVGGKSMDELISTVSKSIIEKNKPEDIAQAGQDWLIFDLAKLDFSNKKKAVPKDYFKEYFDGVRVKVKTKKGVLDKKNYTENIKVSLAALAIDKEPLRIEGHNIVSKADNYNAVRGQGLNAEFYALILNSYAKYGFKNEKRYLQDVLAAAHKDGGFSYGGKKSDVDMTAMAVQALAPYSQESKKAGKVVKKALKYLSKKQNKNGGYDTCESVAQVIMAIGAMRYNPLKESKFIKGGKDLGDGLMRYATKDGFSHTEGGETDAMATEQSLRALAAIQQGMQGRSIYER